MSSLTVTPAKRYAALQYIDALRATGEADARRLADVVDVCSYWEAFPTAATADELRAASAVVALIDERGGQAWRDALDAATALISAKVRR